jgi:hypothetical protein
LEECETEGGITHRGRSAVYTVARDRGHNSETMIKKVYGHLHDRTESEDPEVVESRTQHHREAVAERLGALNHDG